MIDLIKTGLTASRGRLSIVSYCASSTSMDKSIRFYSCCTLEADSGKVWHCVFTSLRQIKTSHDAYMSNEKRKREEVCESWYFTVGWLFDDVDLLYMLLFWITSSVLLLHPYLQYMHKT